MQRISDGIQKTIGIIDGFGRFGHLGQTGKNNQPVFGIEFGDDLLAEDQQANRASTAVWPAPLVIGLRMRLFMRNLRIVLLEVAGVFVGQRPAKYRSAA